ncbi:MAG: 2-oxoacid:acceptor oxidoreductase subunit alpha [Campylobacterales bacterium]|nr:2-oxoacid:acceptor oxidoreductase subunit alpha [Campylobacterales bacterium]
MTIEELKKYNGRNGSKAYIAYKNVVYDVTQSPLWQEGEHEGLHYAGEDLTIQLSGAPHGEEVFKNFPVVDTLEAYESQNSTISSLPWTFKMKVERWYQKYHPHPMTVHFPIALHLFAAGLDLLFLYDQKEAYALSVFYTFLVATIMGFVAMIPGILSWCVNYNLSTYPPFIIKLIVSILTLILGILNIGIYLENPDIVYSSSAFGIIYHGIVLLTGLSVIVLGYYGGKITWGDHSKMKTGQTIKDIHENEGILLKIPEEKNELLKQQDHQGLAILIGGAAGSGIDTIEKILSEAFKAYGYYVFSTKEFMSRVRGGSNSTLIRISDTPVHAPCWKVDVSIAMDEASLEHMQERWRSDTLVFADMEYSHNMPDIIPVEMKESAKKFGDLRYINTYMAGFVFGLLKLEKRALLESIGNHLKDDTLNVQVADEGYGAGTNVENITVAKLPQNNKQIMENLHLMDGTTASGFGFLAGGCNMVTSYPMSPSTGVLNFMASCSEKFTIIVEQSEDEIASLNMVLGGWYAGARAMTTTSGGGFALMGEALSLSGMTETPAVIYLAQRPGPATGLPTRSEQGDLNMAIYSGHGPFERIILAPGTLEECIECGYLAFELADRYQIPVIFLSDQHLADSMSTIGQIDFSAFEQHRYIIESDKAYKRYAETEDGISPRSVPGLGEGLVCSVSDEHDEVGQITEDHETRVRMIDKRSRRREMLHANAILPKISGNGNIAIIGWGSTYSAIEEALSLLDDPHLCHVHFSWVHPLGEKQLQVLEAYERKFVVENNADGIFADQLKLHGIKVDDMILQYNGFEFFADELAIMIENAVKEW